MQKRIGRLNLVCGQHVAAGDQVSPATGNIFQPFAWGIGWRRVFAGIVVYRKLTRPATANQDGLQRVKKP